MIIPPEVVAAIIAVMSGVKTLPKDENNKFQKYNFASVDSFLSAINPLCVAAGLAILQEEESFDISTKETSDDYGKTKTSSWLTVRYSFVLVHSSGGSYGPFHRSVMVPANGAQAFGSAQSYALKFFMRSTFQIPTGDKDDADYAPAERLPDQPRKAVDTQAESKPASFWDCLSFELRGTNADDYSAKFISACGKAPTIEKLVKLKADNIRYISALDPMMIEKTKAAYLAAEARLADGGLAVSPDHCPF